jgi:hypothetical protein
MKIRSLLLIAAFVFSASAYADSYTCSATNTTGIYALNVDGGTATLMVNGITYTAQGAGSMYMFDSTFAMGDVSFNTSPMLSLPTDGSENDISFNATISDNTGNTVDLSCSR